MDFRKKMINGVFFVALILMSLYFLAGEIKQMILCGCSGYFCEVWNYVDFIPPMMIIFALVADVFIDPKEYPDVEEFQLTCQTFAAFFMWLKVFFFLRIYRLTGFFVNMLSKVVHECRIFMLLYILIHMAFGTAFWILSEG